MGNSHDCVETVNVEHIAGTNSHLVVYNAPFNRNTGLCFTDGFFKSWFELININFTAIDFSPFLLAAYFS